ncbi:GtrA family protein [Candidatus Saccharibacteria bacterium]|nr:GtrA family protein [Candidatus Saccharibacteria bacterium]
MEEKLTHSKSPEDRPSKDSIKPTTDVSTARHAGRYLLVGIAIAAFNYLVYQLIARFLIKDSNLLWLSNLIATTLAVIVAYILHSRITWKERNPGKYGIIRFFIWNAALALLISPGLTWFFGLFHPIYDFTHHITSSIGLPFDHDFVESTGIFIFANIVIMIINFLFYDKFVFGKSKTSPKSTHKTSQSSPPYT